MTVTIDKRDLFTIDSMIADVAESMQRDYHDDMLLVHLGQIIGLYAAKDFIRMHAMQRLEDVEADDDMEKLRDAVQVVRCKECAYRPCKQMPYSYDHDYCSYGERNRDEID